MSEEPSRRPGKVARLIEEYDLSDFGEELEAQWTAEGSERRSLRDLATLFNIRLLEERMRNVGLQSLKGELKNLYRLLDDENVGRADRTRAKRRLERSGVDVESLMDDFVSYQAIRSYLQKGRGVEYSGDDGDPLENGKEAIRKLRERTRTITQSKIDHLRETDRLDIDEYRVLVNVRVYCESCGKQHDGVDLIERGGCPCEK